MSTIPNSRSSSASSSSPSSKSSTPTPTASTSTSSLNHQVRPAPAPGPISDANANANANANTDADADVIVHTPPLPSAPTSNPTPLTPVHPSFTLMTPTPPPSSSRPLPDSPSDNKHNHNHSRNLKWRGSPLMTEITNVEDRCAEKAAQVQSQSQYARLKEQEHPDTTTTSSSNIQSSAAPVSSSSPSPSSAASAITAACSTNTPNPLQTTNVYINGLPPHFKAEQLYALTAQFGTVLSCRTFTRQLAECPSGYGFVLFETLPAAQQCIDVLRSHHNLHPTFAKQAHKITRTPMMGTLSASASTPVYTASSPNSGLNNSTSNSSFFVADSLSSSTMPNNKIPHSAYTNTASSAYIPSSMNVAFTNGEVKYEVNLAEDDSEDGGADIYIEGLPATLMPSTLRALLAPHVPRAHRFFADTRRVSDSDSDGLGGIESGKGGGRTGRLVVFVRLSSRAAAHDIRAKLHGRTIRGYSTRLRVSFADDLDAERAREAELAPDLGHVSEYGFGFEGGGVGVHGADDGGRYGAYGTMDANGTAYGNANANVDVYAAGSVYGYSDADANMTGTVNIQANALKPITTATTVQKTTQQPVISGLPVPASGGYNDPFYEGFEGSGGVLGYGNEEWNGTFDGSGAGNLGYRQRQDHNQIVGHGTGSGLGNFEQVQQLLQVQKLLQSQNQCQNQLQNQLNTPIPHCSDRLNPDTLPTRSRVRQYTDPPSPSPHAQTTASHTISALSHEALHANLGANTHANLTHRSTHTQMQAHIIPAPLQPISATLHELQLQLDNLRPLLAAYNQGRGVQGQAQQIGQGIGKGMGFNGDGGGGSINSLNASPSSGGNRDTGAGPYYTTPSTFNVHTSLSTFPPQALRPRSLSTAHAQTYNSGSASIFGGTGGAGGTGFGRTGSALNPRAQTYAHPHAHSGNSGRSTNFNAKAITIAAGISGSDKASSNPVSSDANSANSHITLSLPSNTSNTHTPSAPAVSNNKSTSTSPLSPVSSHSHTPSPALSLTPTPTPGLHVRAQTSTDPTPSTRSRAHTTTGHGLGHGFGGLETLAMGGTGGSMGGVGVAELGAGLGAPLFPHPQGQSPSGSQTQRNGA